LDFIHINISILCLTSSLQLRASTTPIETEPSEDPRAHIQQLRTLKLAYESIIPKDPYLPSPESPIPALLALRGTHKCIEETQDCITTTELDYQKLQKRLEKEQNDLKDANLIQAGLEARISTLQGEIVEHTQKSPGQVAQEMIREMKKKKQNYDSDTGKLVKAFNSFIDEYLGPMLAAEELGGPIAGYVLDVDEAMLQAGFSTQGKVKRSKRGVNEDKRQRRIDEIWGARDAGDKPRDEKEEAAMEMRELTEQLLNSVVEADGSGPGVYVDIERESAAARFLVRSKVAQFHPKDARKLRLIDFGGELDD
jgi:hypothetical protein